MRLKIFVEQILNDETSLRWVEPLVVFLFEQPMSCSSDQLYAKWYKLIIVK